MYESIPLEKYSQSNELTVKNRLTNPFQNEPADAKKFNDEDGVSGEVRADVSNERIDKSGQVSEGVRLSRL
jgi:hypothetical protein